MDGEATLSLRSRQAVKVGQVAATAWRAYKKQMAACISGFVICGVMTCVAQIFAEKLGEGLAARNHEEPALIASDVGLLVGLAAFETWLVIGQAILLLKVARGEPAAIGLVFVGGRYLVRNLAAGAILGASLLALLLGCAIGAGVVYLVTQSLVLANLAFVAMNSLPVLYMATTFSQCSYLIIDHDLGAIESLRISSRLTRGSKLPIFGVFLMSALLAVVGLFVFCIGAALTVPYAMLNLAVLYLHLNGDLALPPSEQLA